MSVQIARCDRTSPKSDDALHARPEERAQAVESYFGYFGRFTVDESAGTVTHHVEAGSAPGFDRTDQRRHFRLQGDRLTLATQPERMGDADLMYVATWERLQRDRDASEP
jgi:hypothetical protein